nr:PAS domain-containing protein [uncultured Albidiferax sp.]
MKKILKASMGITAVPQRSSFEAKILIAFTAAVLVVAALFAITWQLEKEASEAARRVAHTQEVIGNIARARADTLQVEFSTQNYRITGDVAQLLERDATIATREAVLQQIQQLTRDNPDQQQRWSGLRAVVNQRIEISKHVEWLRKTQGQEAATAFVATAPLRETRERTYRLLREMEAEETRLLALRNAEQQHGRKTLLVSGALATLLLLVLLVSTYALIRRQLRIADASQRALADNEDSLTALLQSIGDAVLATDIDGRITRMNPLAERLTGWPLAQARGRPVSEVFCIINEQTRQPAEVPVDRVLATGTLQELANHTLLVHRNGSECPIADSAAPIRDAQGLVRGVVLVFRDETTPRQVQRSIRDHNLLLEQRVQERTLQLQESQEHLRSVISNVPALIAYVDAQQRYVYVNKPYLQRFAPGQADIAGRTVREILGPERYAVVSPMVTEVLKGQPQGYDWQPFPGVWQVIRYMPKRDTYGQVEGYYVLGSDITERKQAEEKIQALNTELAQRVRDLEQVGRALKT